MEPRLLHQCLQLESLHL